MKWWLGILILKLTVGLFGFILSTSNKSNNSKSYTGEGLLTKAGYFFFPVFWIISLPVIVIFGIHAIDIIGIIVIFIITALISLMLGMIIVKKEKELYEARKMANDEKLNIKESHRYFNMIRQKEKLEYLKTQYEKLRLKPKLDNQVKEYFDKKIKKQEEKVGKIEKLYNQSKNERLGNKKITMKDYFEENNIFSNNIDFVDEFICLTPREEQDTIERMRNPNMDKIKLWAIEEFLTARQKITELISVEFLHNHGEKMFNELKISLKEFHNARKKLEKIDCPERTDSEFEDIE